MSSSQDTQQEQHVSIDDDEKQPQPQPPRSISFSLLVTASAVCLCILLMAALLPALLVFADRSHHALIARITIERSELMRDAIASTVNDTFLRNTRAVNFTRRFGVPHASNASLRRYRSFFEFTRWATDGAFRPDGTVDLVGCRFADNSWVHGVVAGANGLVQMNRVHASPGQALPRYDPLLHGASGAAFENVSDVQHFFFNASSLNAFPDWLTALVVKPTRFTTATWVGGNSLWNAADAPVPLQLTRLVVAGVDQVTTYQLVAAAGVVNGAHVSSCIAPVSHERYGRAMRELLVGAEHGARVFLFDVHMGFVTAQSHGIPFVLSNLTAATPRPLPQRCIVAEPRDVACYPDPLLAYPLLRALGWSNLSQPLPSLSGGGGGGGVLLEHVEIDGSGTGHGRHYSAHVSELRTLSRALRWRLFLFTPEDLLDGPVRDATGAAIGITVAVTFVAIALGAILLRSVAQVVSDLAERLEDPWRLARSRRELSSGAISDNSNLSSSSNISRSSSFFGSIASVVVCCAFAELVDVEAEYDAMSAVVEQLRGFLSQAVLLRRKKDKKKTSTDTTLSTTSDASGGGGGDQQKQQQQQQQRERGARSDSSDEGVSTNAKVRRRVRFSVVHQEDQQQQPGVAVAVSDEGGTVVVHSAAAGDARPAAVTDSGSDASDRDESFISSPNRAAASPPRAHKSKSRYTFVAPSMQLVCSLWAHFPVYENMLNAIQQRKFSRKFEEQEGESSQEGGTTAATTTAAAAAATVADHDDGAQVALQDLIEVSKMISKLVALLVRKNPIVNVTEYLGDSLVLCFYVRSLAVKSRVLVSLLRQAMQLAAAIPPFMLTSSCIQCTFPSIVHWWTPPSSEKKQQQQQQPPRSPTGSGSNAVGDSCSSPSSSTPSPTAPAQSPAAEAPPRKPIMIHRSFMSMGVCAGVARLLESEESSSELISRRFIYLGTPVANAARLAAAACAEKILVNSCVDPGPDFRLEGQKEEAFLGGLVAPNPRRSNGGSADCSGSNNDLSLDAARSSPSEPPTPHSENWLRPAASAQPPSPLEQQQQAEDDDDDVAGDAFLRHDVVVGGELPAAVTFSELRKRIHNVLPHSILLPRSLIGMLHTSSRGVSRPPPTGDPLAAATCSMTSADPRAAVVALAVPPRPLAFHAAGSSELGHSDDGGGGWRRPTLSRAFFAVARVVPQQPVVMVESSSTKDSKK